MLTDWHKSDWGKQVHRRHVEALRKTKSKPENAEVAEAAEAQAARHLACIAEQGTAAAGNVSGGRYLTRERQLGQP
jgi:hypothetical protein